MWCLGTNASQNSSGDLWNPSHSSAANLDGTGNAPTLVSLVSSMAKTSCSRVGRKTPSVNDRHTLGRSQPSLN